ncbi:hypothetical protein [Pseudomonas putida]
MKRLLLGLLLAASGAAHAGIPLLNATCPGNIEVHADKGGPFEAKGGGVTVSLSINPDGSPDVSYTGKNKANGVCQIKD